MQMICIYLSILIALVSDDTAWKRLESLARISQAQVLERLETDFPEAKILVVSKPKEAELEAHKLYEGYWLTQKKFRPYPGLFISAHKKLPGDFEKRDWSDKHILILETTTPRDVVFHLLLHFLHPELEQRQKVAEEVIRLQKEAAESPGALLEARLKLFRLDIEVLTDLYLLEKRAEFEWSQEELESISKRLRHQLSRLEREFSFLKASAEKLTISTESAEEFLKRVQTTLQIKEDEK